MLYKLDFSETTHFALQEAPEKKLRLSNAHHFLSVRIMMA